MEEAYSSIIWPVLYFKADWPSKSYSFDLGIQLIKADRATLEAITESSVDNNCWLSNIAGADDMRRSTDWFLAMRRPQVHGHISAAEIGISFVDSLQEATKESFLMTLQLVRPTAAICPFEFPTEIREDSISSDDVDTSSDFYGINSERPPVYAPEIFKIHDLQTLTELWSSLIKLRKLDSWKKLINREEFFADCDRKAGEEATRKILDVIMSNPAFLELSEEDRKQHKGLLKSSIKDAEDKGEWWQEYYRESFQKVFSEQQQEQFSNRTRIGRALNLFFKGLHLPLQHSFLSMCLVLETIFERARQFYNERSNVVHGRKSIETVEPGALKDAFYFARHSLQHILLDSELLALYSDPITKDKPKVSDKTIKAIRDYFRDLDLR